MLITVMSRVSRPLGLLLAMLAFVSLLALGATVLPDDAEQTKLDAVSILCVTSSAALPTQAPHPPRHHAAPVLCPLSLALALPLVLLALLPMLLGPAVRHVAWRRRDAADSRPGSLASCLGLPRGPPALA